MAGTFGRATIARFVSLPPFQVPIGSIRDRRAVEFRFFLSSMPGPAGPAPFRHATQHAGEPMERIGDPIERVGGAMEPSSDPRQPFIGDTE